MGMTNAMYDSQLMSNVVSTSYDTWTELLDNDKLLNEQYKVLAGRMPSAYNEVVVMVNKDNEISDYSLYCMGLMDSEELINAVKSAMSNNNEKVEFTSKLQTYTYDELLGLEFRLVTNPEFYEKENGVWIDKSDDKIYMTKVVEDAEPIKVVGIIKPEENSIMSSSSSSAIGYTHELTEYLVNKVNDSEVVKEQKNSPDTDIFTCKGLGQENPHNGRYTGVYSCITARTAGSGNGTASAGTADGNDRTADSRCILAADEHRVRRNLRWKYDAPRCGFA